MECEFVSFGSRDWTTGIRWLVWQ